MLFYTQALRSSKALGTVPARLKDAPQNRSRSCDRQIPATFTPVQFLVPRNPFFKNMVFRQQHAEIRLGCVIYYTSFSCPAARERLYKSRIGLHGCSRDRVRDDVGMMMHRMAPSTAS